MICISRIWFCYQNCGFVTSYRQVIANTRVELELKPEMSTRQPGDMIFRLENVQQRILENELRSFYSRADKKFREIPEFRTREKKKRKD